MSLISVIVLIVVVGLVMWLVNSFLPIGEPYKQILNVFVVVALVLMLIIWLLQLGGFTTGRIGL